MSTTECRECFKLDQLPCIFPNPVRGLFHVLMLIGNLKCTFNIYVCYVLPIFVQTIRFMNLIPLPAPAKNTFSKHQDPFPSIRIQQKLGTSFQKHPKFEVFPMIFPSLPLISAHHLGSSRICGIRPSAARSAWEMTKVKAPGVVKRCGACTAMRSISTARESERTWCPLDEVENAGAV